MKSTSWPPLFALSILFSLQVSARTISEQEQLDLYSFVSRPDLKPPKWNISTHDDAKITPGYWFIGTYDFWSRSDRSEAWIGPHIYDTKGQLIWSGARMSERTGTVDFQLRKISGKDVMTIYRPDENKSIHLNEHFEAIGEEFAAGISVHESTMEANGQHGLIIERAMGEATEEISRAVGLEEGICKGEYYGFKEVDTTTGVTSFQWSSERHIALNESTMEGVPVERRCNRIEGWDFLHVNSVSKCPDGDYVISGEYTDTIYKVSHKDGTIVWRLGGKTNQFTKGALNFSRQSQLQCLDTNLSHTTISFLDNAASGKKEDLQFPSNTLSRGLLLSLDVETMQCHELQSYPHPFGPGNFAFDRSSQKILPEANNVFISWSNRSLITEYTPSGELVQQAELLPFFLNTFKTYKYPASSFVGTPLSPPDVFAQASNGINETSTKVYVSWNGHTEISSWKLYKTNHNGKALIEIASKRKEGFETAFELDSFVSHIVAEAFNAEGRSLGQSTVLTTLPPPEILESSIEEQMEWLHDMGAIPKDTEGQAAAFFGGFFLAVILVLCAYAVRWIYRNDERVWEVVESLKEGRLPWWEQAQSYIPLDESPGRKKMKPVRIEVEEC